MTSNLVALNLPFYPFKIIEKNNSFYIFDEIRKKYLVLSPEEWVRQHFIKFLILEKKIPSSLIQIEGGLKLNKTQKRCDILVFNTLGEKLLIVECKAPIIKITQETFDQVARYNSVHQCNWVAVSNGLQHFYAKIDHKNKTYQFKENLPNYNEYNLGD